MTLAEVKKGEKIRITAFAADKKTLSDFTRVGLKTGMVLSVMNIAPFGSPIEIKIGNLRLAIAKRKAAFIKVEYV